MAEVIIVGAGPAGAALAYLLAGQGLGVQLLDRAAFPRDKTCGDCLSPRAVASLGRLGLLDAVLADGWKVRNVLVIAPSGHALRAPIPAGRGNPDFALVLPRLRLDGLLLRRAVAAGADFLPGHHVTGLTWSGGRVVGVKVGEADLRARLVVLATGAAMGLLRRAGLLAGDPPLAQAARTYCEGMAGLSDALEIHLNADLLPGYGWVFPISPDAANVGAGYCGQAGGRLPRALLEDFLSGPALAGRMSGARRPAPARGYPLRLDFETARPALPGLALVGEACGLVSPLTGEGIEYALESAACAAELFGPALRRGEASGVAAREYSRALRGRFLPAFRSALRVRSLFGWRWGLDRLVAAACRNKALADEFLNVALGNVDPAEMLSLKTLMRVLLG